MGILQKFFGLDNVTAAASTSVKSVFGRTGNVTANSGDYTTDKVSEGAKKYYSDLLARGAISVVPGTGLSYNPLTGVISFSGTGLQGPKGDQGDPGPQGVQGEKGDKGDAGIQGVQGTTGSQGIQGIKGDTGTQGIQGIQGLKGDKGDPGLTGPQGPTGPTGPQGPAGDSGTSVPGTACYDVLSIFTNSANSNISGTQYFSISGTNGPSAAVLDKLTALPISGYLSNLFAIVSGTGTVTITIQKGTTPNLTDTSLTININAGIIPTVFSNTTEKIQVNAGDIVAVKTTATGSVKILNISLTYINQ